MQDNIIQDDMFKNKVPKSIKRIATAFLRIRKTHALEDITVIHLCQMADVNKSTFYHYFHDVYDLSDRMQSRIIENRVQYGTHQRYTD